MYLNHLFLIIAVQLQNLKNEKLIYVCKYRTGIHLIYHAFS